MIHFLKGCCRFQIYLFLRFACKTRQSLSRPDVGRAVARSKSTMDRSRKLCRSWSSCSLRCLGKISGEGWALCSGLLPDPDFLRKV